jgi:hypothetical protein
VADEDTDVGERGEDREPKGVAAAVARAAEKMRAAPPPQVRDLPSTSERGEAEGDHPEDKPTYDADAGKEEERGTTPSKTPRLVSDFGREEAPPKTQPVDDEDLSWKQWVERYGGDEAKAKAAVLATDSRASQLAKEKAALSKENAELKAKLGITPEQPATDEPAGPISADEIHDTAVAAVHEEEQGILWAREWSANDKRYNELGVVDPVSNRVVAGKIHEVGVQIARLEDRLNATKDDLGGVELQALDPVEQDSIREKVRDLKDKRRDLIDQHKSIGARNKALSTAFNARVSQYEAEIRDSIEAESSEKVQSQAAEETHETWSRTLDAIAKANGLSKEAREDLHDDLVLRANEILNVNQDDIPDIKKWMEETAGGLIKKRRAAFSGPADAAYARQKERDTRQPGPRGAASLAPERRDESQMTPRERRREAERNAARLSKSVTLR